MRSRLKQLAVGGSPVGRLLRWAYRAPDRASLPIPGIVALPFLWLYRFIEGLWHAAFRIIVAEPLFKASCHRYGRHLHTGPFVQWISGAGRIVVGDDVTIDGKSSFHFARRFSDAPTLTIGDRTGLGHGCHIAVGKAITIGSDCRIAGGVRMFDSNGHPSDPDRRRRGEPPEADSVKPISLADNVWIGAASIIHPGVNIGAGSIVSAGSVVMSDVPANTIVAGNPARRIGTLGQQPVAPNHPAS